MMEKGRPRDPELLEYVYPVLAELGWLRSVFALLALVWAVLSFKGRPRWGAMIALSFAIAAVMNIFIIM